MKKITNLLGLLMVVCLFTTATTAQVSVNGKDCLGVWKTVDDETGRTKSHVEIFKKGNNYHAKIIKLLDPQTLKDSGEKRFEDIKCDKCPSDHGKDQSMIGLEMVWDMYKSSDKWKGGSIMDPKKGKVYTCTMWMDDSDAKGNTLMVRGWVAMFYRTQTWYRIN
jgi:uncharacterized protein (DUF2147 family)